MCKSLPLGIAAAIFFLTFGSIAIASQSVNLGSGKSVEVLAVGPMMFGQGQSALMLKYRTSIPMDDLNSLRKEADEIWDKFIADVEHAGYSQAIISANSPEEGGFISHSKSYNFIYEKKDNSWRTLEGNKSGASLKLDEKSVRDFMDRMDWLHDHNEVRSFLLYFSNNWVGTLPGPTGPVTVNRMQLAQDTYATLTAVKDYHHQRDILKITVSPDGASAQVDSQEIETGTHDNKPINTTEISTDNVEVQDNNIVLVKSQSVEKK